MCPMSSAQSFMLGVGLSHNFNSFIHLFIYCLALGGFFPCRVSQFLLQMSQAESTLRWETSSTMFSHTEDMSRRHQNCHSDKNGQHVCLCGVFPWGTAPVTSVSSSFRTEPFRDEWFFHTSFHSSVKYYSRRLLRPRNQISVKTSSFRDVNRFESFF